MEGSQQIDTTRPDFTSVATRNIRRNAPGYSDNSRTSHIHTCPRCFSYIQYRNNKKKIIEEGRKYLNNVLLQDNFSRDMKLIYKASSIQKKYKKSVRILNNKFQTCMDKYPSNYRCTAQEDVSDEEFKDNKRRHD